MENALRKQNTIHCIANGFDKWPLNADKNTHPQSLNKIILNYYLVQDARANASKRSTV